MKRNLSIWLGMTVLALVPAFAQTPAPTGKIHGHVNDPSGIPIEKGNVNLSTDNGSSTKYTFQLTANGDYSGEVAPGTYLVFFRKPDTPAKQMVDSFDDIKIAVGQDLTQDFDMTRKAFFDTLTKEQQEIAKKNHDAWIKNQVIKSVNGDLKTSGQDFKDADAAKDPATKTAKYTEIESLMLKDSGALPTQSVLWAQLGQAQAGLKKYDDAAVAYKKVLELEPKAKVPSMDTLGAANAGLGEIYVHTGKVADANAAYDAAVKINPTKTAFYLKNEMVNFFQTGNADAQVAVADQLIKADPTVALAYYLKGNGLVGKSAVDPKTNKLIAPDGCQAAYQKYLELAPTGPYAGEVKSILDSLSATLPPTVAPSKKKKK